MRKLFGTDGIRGPANTHPMTIDVAQRLGQAVALHFARDRRRPKIMIGKDPRLSGYMFESAIAAGINAQGGDVLFTGPLPTPGIAFLATGMRCDAGVVISASHNPYTDNGIKLFGYDGFKLPDGEEAAIEALIFDDAALEAKRSTTRIGRSWRIDDAIGRYIVFLKTLFPNDLTLEGLRVVIDCANGAAYKVAPAVLWELGAEVVTTGVSPDGRNINDGVGALHPEACAELVLERRADIGISLDGDADRCILIDERGNTVDGDQILAMSALGLKRAGKLKQNTVVATVMSNLGLDLALRRHDINLVRTQVGDRYVVEEMRRHGYNLGGEQSGHLVFLDHATTGDGMIGALEVLSTMQRSQRPLSELAKVMQRLPQVLINVRVARKPPLSELNEVSALIAEIEGKLAGEGRVLVRYSGTESKCRVMLEGRDQQEIRSFANAIADALRKEIGA